MAEIARPPAGSAGASAAPRGSAARVPAPFLPSLEGLRAVACCGIIITHVAFQTGADTGSLLHRVLARTDFFVPVFFALSGFLLWRRHRADFGSPLGTGRGSRRRGLVLLGYYAKRLGRILPAYLVTVALVLALFPVAESPSVPQVLANLTMTQIYLPGGLVGGLTHLWSLCVEMAFYLVLPLIAWAIGRRARRVRVAWIVGVAALSFGWAFLPPFASAPGPGELDPHIMPPAFAAWFAVGFLAAELEEFISDAAPQPTPPLPAAGAGAGASAGAAGWSRSSPHHAVAGDPGFAARYELPVVRRVARLRWVFWLLALGALVVAALDGPEGLVHLGPGEFARRTFYGLVFAAALIVPYAVAPASAWLESRWMQALGRWSYGVFLWHMAVLSVVFPLLGVGVFQGFTALVLVATFAFSVPVAALSFALVEEPARRWVSARWAKFAER